MKFSAYLICAICAIYPAFRRLCRFASPMFIAAITALQCGSFSLAAEKPNVILIMTDDQGYGDLSCHGNPDIETPHLDAFYDESVRFTDFHVDPTCAPTRAALLTGRYSLSTGVWHTVAGRSFLHPEEVTLGDAFKKNGYATGMFGKWHLGDNYPCRPQDRGFDDSIWHGGGGIGQTPDRWGNDYFDDIYWYNGQATQFDGYCTDVFFSVALDFIEYNKDKPFFCYLTPNAPHGPYLVDEKYSKPFLDNGIPPERANFYGMLVNIDENVGRFLDKLDTMGLAENTIVIFMTDNGTAGPWYPKGGEDFTAGLRGIKGSIYEGGHRVPFFARWPKGGVGGGRDVGTLSAHIDVMPTLMDLCGLKKPEGPDVHGMSLAPLLRGDLVEAVDRVLVVNNQRVAVPKKYKDFAVMTSQWRLVGKTELYDIRNDRGQETNVADAHPDEVERLTGKYEAWWERNSGRAENLVPIVVGTNHENPTRLTAHDWHAEKVPWGQEVVLEAPMLKGHWELDIVEDGLYWVTISQQPPGNGFPIDAVLARARFGDQEQAQDVLTNMHVIHFSFELKKGRTQFEATFITEKNELRGAYYAEIERTQ